MFYWLGLREYMVAYKITQGLVILFTLKKPFYSVLYPAIFHRRWLFLTNTFVLVFQQFLLLVSLTYYYLWYAWAIIMCLWHSFKYNDLGVSISRYLTSIGIPMLKIRRSHDRVIFNMGSHPWERPPLYRDGAQVCGCKGTWVIALSFPFSNKYGI